MRLIDADALINTLQELFDKREKEARFTGDRGVTVTWNDAIYHIKIAPTIEECKTGKWIHTDTQAGYDINGDLVWADMMKCETCGFEIDVIQGHIAQYNFCPNCGADMRGEQG